MASTRYDRRGRSARIAFVLATGTLLFLLLAWWALQADRFGERTAEVPQHAHTNSSNEQAGALFGDATSYETSLELPMASQELVEEYQGRGDCIVRQSGYLDLVGDAWSCVIEGPGWVDLCVVFATSDDGGSLVRVQRLDASSFVEGADA